MWSQIYQQESVNISKNVNGTKEKTYKPQTKITNSKLEHVNSFLIVQSKNYGFKNKLLKSKQLIINCQGANGELFNDICGSKKAFIYDGF